MVDRGQWRKRKRTMRGFDFGAYRRRGLTEAAGIEAGRGGGSLYHGGGTLLMVALEREGDREAHEQEGGSATGEAHQVVAHRGRGADSRGGIEADLNVWAPTCSTRSGEGSSSRG
jgi:hypothetical protein